MSRRSRRQRGKILEARRVKKEKEIKAQRQQEIEKRTQAKQEMERRRQAKLNPKPYTFSGNLSDLEASNYIVKCSYCGRKYTQELTDQIPGFREEEYDICPYCRKVNGSSHDVEFFNRKLDENY